MNEPELIRSADRLVEFYRACFQIKNGTKAIMGVADHTTLKDLVEKVGEQRTNELLGHYFKMEDQWFVSRGHDLHTFKRNINTISASLQAHSALKKTEDHSDKGYSATFICDKCERRELFLVPFNYDWDKPTICGRCNLGFPPNEDLAHYPAAKFKHIHFIEDLIETVPIRPI